MNPAKAPWYFLGLQEMLVYFDPWIAGVVMPTMIIIGLMVIPYIDTNPLGSGYYTLKQRKFSIATFMFGFVILWVAMIIIGTFIRGPGWQWFWPGQTWDHNRLIYEVNRDLPDLFKITSNMGKAIFGAIVVGGFYLVGGGAVYSLFRRKMQKDFQRMSLLQFSLMAFLWLTMLALPLKMALRLVWHIKYVRILLHRLLGFRRLRFRRVQEGAVALLPSILKGLPRPLSPGLVVQSPEQRANQNHRRDQVMQRVRFSSYRILLGNRFLRHQILPRKR